MLLPLVAMVLVSAWTVDRAFGTGVAGTLAGIAGAAVASMTWLTRSRRLARLAVAGALGAAVAIALGAWSLERPLAAGTLERQGTDLIASIEAAVSGGSPAADMQQILVAALAWTHGFVAVTGFGRVGRMRDPIVLLGLPLLVATANLPEPDLLPAVLGAALVLVLNLAVVEQRRTAGWRRRDLEAEPQVPRHMRRAGWLATAGTVVLAWVLATVAVGAPLDSVLRDAERFMSDLTQQIDGLPVGGPAFGNPQFGPSFTLGSRFDPSDEAVARVWATSLPSYLRASTHDRYTGTGWDQAVAAPRTTAANEPLLPDPTLELGDLDGRPTQTILITPEQALDVLLLPPGAVYLSRPSEVSATVDGSALAIVQGSADAGDAYSVTALSMPAAASQLVGAGDVYPDAVTDHYLALDGVSAATIAEAQRVTTGLATPYERAIALVTYLRSDLFEYRTSIERPLRGVDVVDWFLFGSHGRAGFCEQFASAMVLMARAAGIPARLARGYAGGERIGTSIRIFREADRHAWAELYFPGFGWQPFEATPSRPSIDRGQARPQESDGPTPTAPAGHLPPETVASPTTTGEAATRSDTPGPGEPLVLLLAGIVALVLLAGVLAAATVRRGQSRAIGAAQSWLLLTEAATRAGIPRHASETPYEYAVALQRRLPAYGSEIASIAAAVVVERYAPPGHAVQSTSLRWAGVRRALLRLEVGRRVARLLRRHGP